ncbi:UspA - like 9 [Theobroma cacao]|nr:UspA - like 9 [Theobroma cacao]
MDVRKIVVVVEDEDVARTALQWALHNLLRYGDLLTLLHVFSPTTSRSKKKARRLRLQGYQLALSFKETCNSNFFNRIVLQTNIEIIVTEGDQEGRKILAIVREIGASVLVVGLHDQSFLYNKSWLQIALVMVSLHHGQGLVTKLKSVFFIGVMSA